MSNTMPGAPGAPGGQSAPGSVGQTVVPTPVDFATHASQVSAQTSLGNIDTSTSGANTHLTSLDTNIGTHMAAIDTSTASASTHLTNLDTNIGTHMAAIDTSSSGTAANTSTIASNTKPLSRTEFQYATITHNVDTTITFVFGTAARIRVSNWSTTAVLLVKATAISGSTDAAAARVPAATSAVIPGILEFPWNQSTVHVFTGDSGTTVNVTVEGFQ